MREAYSGRLAGLLEEEERKGVSNAQVARDIGVTPEALNKMKLRGSVPQDLVEFLLLCRRLNTHPNYLWGWDANRYPDKPPFCAAELDATLKANRRRRRK
jgi:hypothetical protein